MPAKPRSIPADIAALLLDWYDVHARDLPWRSPPGAPPPDPYRVWLSEIMLQQTTVATVRPRFAQFTARWPDFASLAAADEAELMAAWAGLGYYARARNLVACARDVVARHGGVFPGTEAELRALPGIGAYTAAAIASIAFGQRAVVVDGNVERVLSRFFAISAPLPAARPAIRAATDTITPDARSGDFAQAMMDLGSSICTPRNPQCLLCPLCEGCAARAEGQPDAYPVKKTKAASPQRFGTIFWAEREGKVLLVRRPPHGLLGGMRALPTGRWADTPPGLADAPFDIDWRMLPGTVTHVFTHFRLELALAVARGAAHSDAGEWWPIADIESAGLPTVFAKAGGSDQECDMKALRYMVSAGALIALVTGAELAGQAAPQAAPTPLAVVPSALPTTQALIEGYVRDNKMPGIVTAFGYHDGPTMFLTAGKIADDATAAKAGPDSLWRVYSMTKPITGMAAMILIEEGKMSLDQPISDFIPAFKKMTVLDKGGRQSPAIPRLHPITIRNLLTHTAGLGYNIVTTGPLLAEYTKLGINPAQVSSMLEGDMRKTRPATLQEFANRVATLPLIAEPGTKWSYSIGLDVMGAVIEKASGMRFDAFVQARIFDPLKMNSSYWTVPQSEIGRFSTNYIFTRAAMAQLNPGKPVDTSAIPEKARIPLDAAATSVWLTPPSFPYGGAGLVMSARDYDTFLHMLQNYGELGGVRIMKAGTAKLAMSNLMPTGVFFPGAVAATGGTTQPMGFGAGGSVSIADTPGGVPKGTYGWGGAAGTIAFVDPVRRVRGTVMVNYFPGETYPLRAEILPAFRADLVAMHR